MPQIEGSGRFMDELVRQIDLLPVPASLDGRSEEEKQANIRMILDVARSIKRRYRRCFCHVQCSPSSSSLSFTRR